MTRRPVALAAAALLSGPMLAACGFDYPTDRINTNGAGVTDRSGQVYMLGMAIVAEEDGIGNLTGSLSNYADEDDALVGFSGGDQDAVEPIDFEPVDLAADGLDGSFVNLAELVVDGDPVTLTGVFGAGDIIPMTFEFENAEPIQLDVPVEKACFEFEGLAPQADVATQDDPGEVDEPDGSPTPETDDEAIADEPSAAYNCVPEERAAEGEE